MTQAWHSARDRPRQTHPSAHQDPGPGRSRRLSCCSWELPGQASARPLPTPCPHHTQRANVGKIVYCCHPCWWNTGAVGWNWGGSQHLLEQGDGLIHLPELRLCLLQLGVQKRYVVMTHPRGPKHPESRAQAGEMVAGPLCSTHTLPSRPPVECSFS